MILAPLLLALWATPMDLPKVQEVAAKKARIPVQEEEDEDELDEAPRRAPGKGTSGGDKPNPMMGAAITGAVAAGTGVCCGACPGVFVPCLAPTTYFSSLLVALGGVVGALAGDSASKSPMHIGRAIFAGVAGGYTAIMVNLAGLAFSALVANVLLYPIVMVALYGSVLFALAAGGRGTYLLFPLVGGIYALVLAASAVAVFLGFSLGALAAGGAAAGAYVASAKSE